MARVVWWVERWCIALTEIEQVKRQIEIVETDLERAPEGSLVCYLSEDKYRFYWQKYSGKKRDRIYLGEEDWELKLALANKKVNRAVLTDYKNQLAALEAYEKKAGVCRVDEVIKSEPIRQLILENGEKWERQKYETNYRFLKKRVHAGPNGVFLLSKSEANISWGLYDWQLPNQYEKKLYFDFDGVIPDFTIRDPASNRIILWEHFGKMDDPSYAERTYRKLDLYMKYGYFPGENLIVTFEDQNHPLTHQRIETEIQYHFKTWIQANGRRRAG